MWIRYQIGGYSTLINMGLVAKMESTQGDDGVYNLDLYAVPTPIREANRIDPVLADTLICCLRFSDPEKCADSHRSIVSAIVEGRSILVLTDEKDGLI